MINERPNWPVFLGGFMIGLGLGIMICTTILGFQRREQEKTATVPTAYIVPADVRVHCIASIKNPCARRGAHIIGDGPTVESAVRAMQEDLKTVACE